MIYLVGLLAGFLNGFFASGAGQIIVFYLVFIKKIDSHLGRAVSIAILSVASLFSIWGYTHFIHYDMTKIGTTVIIALIGGYIGSKLMTKIDSKILNLMSGIIITSLAIYGFLK